MKKLKRSRKPLQFVMLTLPWAQLPDYPDIGSYRMNADNSPAFIGCADTGDDISNSAILLHEFIESMWCWINGISEKSVRDFDLQWFKDQSEGKHNSTDEPGMDTQAPYHIGHLIATRYERDWITQCKMMWNTHEQNCEKAQHA